MGWGGVRGNDEEEEEEEEEEEGEGRGGGAVSLVSAMSIVEVREQ